MSDAVVTEEAHPSAHLEDHIHQCPGHIVTVTLFYCVLCKFQVPLWYGSNPQSSQVIIEGATRHNRNAEIERICEAASVELQDIRVPIWCLSITVSVEME